MSPRVKSIIEEVARAHNVPVADLMSRSLFVEHSRARREAMWRVRQLSPFAGLPRWNRRDPFSFPKIGKIFGRDHSTVQTACKRYEAERAAEPKSSPIEYFPVSGTQLSHPPGKGSKAGLST